MCVPHVTRLLMRSPFERARNSHRIDALVATVTDRDLHKRTFFVCVQLN